MQAHKQSNALYIFPILTGSVGTIFLGRISVIEIVALIWFLFFGGFKKLPALFCRDYAYAGFFYLSSFGLLLSDFINSTSIENTIKGPGAYLLFPTTLIFLLSIFNKNQLWVALVCASITGIFTSEVVVEFGLSQQSFKMGFSSATIYLILSIGLLLTRSFPRFYNVRMITLLSTLSVIFLAYWGNLRLLALCAVVALLLDQACSLRPLRSLILESSSKTKILLFFLIAFPLALVIISTIAARVSVLLVNLIAFDFFSQDAIDKTLVQSTGSLGVLFGGRSEVFSSYLAFLERPLLGWGSWATDPNNTFNLAGKVLMSNLGYELNFTDLTNQLKHVRSDRFIPTHSVLLNLLVWGGLLSFPPIYVSICQFAINLLKSGALKTGYFYPFAFVQVLLLWTLLFSPFSYSNRLTGSLMMAVSVAHFRSLKNAQKFISIATVSSNV